MARRMSRFVREARREMLIVDMLIKHGLDSDWHVFIEDMLQLKGHTVGKHCAYYTAGLCLFDYKLIFIDKRIESDFEDVLLHEIAHALVGKPGHGPEWKKVARRMGCTDLRARVRKGR